MKILIPSGEWVGGTLDFLGETLKKLGHDVYYVYKIKEKDVYKLTYYLKLRQIKKFEAYINSKLEQKYNEKIIKTINEYKPDIFLSLNARFFPETLRKIRNLGITTICWLADYPFDSTRFKYFPYTLQYFNYLFLGEMLWRQNIQNVAPDAKIIHMVGAFCPQQFKPISVVQQDVNKYNSNIAFAGASYGIKAEGAYRAGILAQINDFGLKIWGDNGWKRCIFNYYPQLKYSYAGERLDFNELNKLYQITKININIPNPQCITTFQERIFEISGAKGFQIVDYRKDIDKYFTEDEIVTFKNINDLREKIDYFLKYPEYRKSYIENSYKKVIEKHTYEIRIKEMFEYIK